MPENFRTFKALFSCCCCSSVELALIFGLSRPTHSSMPGRCGRYRSHSSWNFPTSNKFLTFQDDFRVLSECLCTTPSGVVVVLHAFQSPVLNFNKPKRPKCRRNGTTTRSDRRALKGQQSSGLINEKDSTFRPVTGNADCN